MDFDEIIIGSGLAALGTVLGLSAQRSVLVIGGALAGYSQFYDASRTVPCAHMGMGGLGNFWHGVIPTSGRHNFAGSHPAHFAQLFERFYPGTDVAYRLGSPWLFVPWRPIRPQNEWRRLAAERGSCMRFAYETVLRFSVAGSHVSVRTDGGSYRAARVWVCAGALQSPALLDRSLDVPVSRHTVSDHVICYLGLVNRDSHSGTSPPHVQRTRQGVWFEAQYDEADGSLCTLRPARFGFRRLDQGIEQRAVFGLPMGSAVVKILRRASPGLMSEALYNRSGLFRRARMYSAYAQIAVADAHWLRDGETPLEMRNDAIRAAVDAARVASPWPRLIPSRRPEIFIPGIHLHGSVDPRALESAGANAPTSAVQVVDASVHEHVGPDHHTFKVMVAAMERARALSQS